MRPVWCLSLPCLCRYGSAQPCLAKQFFQIPGREEEKDENQSNIIEGKAYSNSAHLTKY